MTDEVNAFVPRKLPQIYAASVASIGGLALGAGMAWPSPSILDLIDRDDFGTISPETISWIVSIVSLGALAGGPVAGFGIERIGRKWTLILLTIPFTAANLVVALSNGVPMMLAGRFFSGFCIGMATLAAPAYIAEIATPAVRGVLGSIFNAMLTLGTVMTFLLGALVNWRVISYIHAVIPTLLCAGMLTVPESPIYLLIKGDTEGARRSLAWLRGTKEAPDRVDGEIQIVQQRLLAVREANKAPTSYRDLLRHGTWQPTAIALSLVFYNQMSGVIAMLSYSTAIVESTGSGIDPNVVSAVLGSIAIVSTLIMDKFGRRKLLITSDAGMAVGLAVIGVFFYMEEQRSPEEGKLKGGITWMPLAALVVYNLFYNIGLGPLPRVVSTEILPQRVKGLTLTISLSLNWSLAFVVSKTFSNIREALNPSGFFWLYASVCATGVVFIYLVVPETKGKTFAEIEGIWTKKAKVVEEGGGGQVAVIAIEPPEKDKEILEKTDVNSNVNKI